MGCFGDMTPTKQVDSSQTSAPPEWVQQAGQANYNAAQNYFNQGYTPYTGDRVASLSANEKTASDLIAATASTPNPYSATAAGDFQSYGAAPGYNYNFSTVTDQNGPLGKTSDYMDPYLEAVLAPQLRQLGISGAQQRQGINKNASLAGAYGDARHGVVEGEQRRDQTLAETDTVGRAMSNAYTQAMQQRQQDAGRQFQTQQAQAGEDKNTLDRARTSGIDLTNLDKYDTSRDLGLAQALGQTGAIGRGVEQQKLDTNFDEYLRKQNFTDQQVAFLTSILKGTPVAQTTSGTQTTSQPNNSGWQALGSVAGAAAPEIASMAAALFL